MDEKKNEDWKIHLLWICIVAVILFYKGRGNDATLKQVGEIKEWAEIVEEDAEKLHAAMARFDDENWQDVVPSVRQTAKALHSTTERLCIEINKLEEDLTPAPPEPGDYDPR